MEAGGGVADTGQCSLSDETTRGVPVSYFFNRQSRLPGSARKYFFSYKEIDAFLSFLIYWLKVQKPSVKRAWCLIISSIWNASVPEKSSVNSGLAGAGRARPGGFIVTPPKLRRREGRSSLFVSLAQPPQFQVVRHFPEQLRGHQIDVGHLTGAAAELGSGRCDMSKTTACRECMFIWREPCAPAAGNTYRRL